MCYAQHSATDTMITSWSSVLEHCAGAYYLLAMHADSALLIGNEAHKCIPVIETPHHYSD